MPSAASRSVPAGTQAVSHKLMVIDASVEDAQVLTAGLAGYDVLRLGPSDAPLQTIAAEARRLGSLSSLVVVSHGADGGLSLGGQWVDQAALDGNAAALDSLAHTLGAGASIQLYGCDVAASARGRRFVRSLAEKTGASVAASTDATGAARYGADWDLEFSVGAAPIETPFAAAQLDQYQHTLSHFRGGAITWQAVELDGDGQKNDVEITVKTAWRYNSVNLPFLSTSPAFTATQVSNSITYVNGDASLADYALQTTIFQAHDLDPNTQYLVSYTGCCRISTLQNNADGDWNIQSQIYMKDGNLAPKVDLPIIFEVPQYQSDGVTPLNNWTFDVGSTDPNADKLRFRLANLTELGGGSSTNPSGLSINPNTGLLTWTGSGSMTSGMYSGGIIAEDVDSSGNVKSKSHVDFILSLQPKAAVGFTYSSTIPETRNVRVEKGSTFSFSINGTAINTISLGDVQGALTNPSAGNFTFDPGTVGTGLTPGTYPITFEIIDTNGIESKSYLTLNFIVPDPNAPAIANIEADRTTYSSASAQLVDQGLDAVVSDVDDINLDGGALKFNVTFTDGQYENLGIQSVGTGAGQISVSGSDVLYEGNVIGTIDAVQNGMGTALRIDFTTADATLAAVQALVRSLTYEDTFTLREAGDRALSLYIEDPSGSANSYDFFVDVQDHPSRPVTGPPQEAANELTIVEGDTIALSNEDISYADPDAGDTITLTPSNVQHGQFELVANPGVAITSFTQEQVTLGQIAFAHDGTESAPSYDISASDGTNPPTTPSAATISFTTVPDAPVISNAPATSVDAGTSYSFTPTVVDDDTGATATFSIVNKPSWASFDMASGLLDGTPTLAEVGTYSNVTITVTDDTGLTGNVGPFSITVVDPCIAAPNGAQCLALDSDGDGLTNGDEDTLGTDRNDADSDGDGANDGAEVGGDVNNPTDSDGDGIIDALESSSADADGDGTNDQADPANLDPCVPSAGTAACLAFDSDGDGLTNGQEDALGTGRYTADTDGDGANDAAEVGGDLNNPTDSDADGKIDALESSISDADGDGTADQNDGNDADPCFPNGSVAACQAFDSDGDGLTNAQEAALGTDPNAADSDGDGIDDGTEIGDPNNPVDSDGDGIADALESNTDDTDGDGIVDAQDTDSDNDGIPDGIEVGPDPTQPVDSDGDGTPDLRDPDSDDDGIPDAIEARMQNGLPADSDGDGTPDYLDVDSDGDGLPDRLEDIAIGQDLDGDGIDDAYDADYTGGADPDKDGVDDSVASLDADLDGLPNYIDPDSDNDGIGDLAEAGMSGADADGDGIDDALDPQQTGGADTNGDGIDDAFVLPDTDGDGVADLRDLDSDNDAINDVVEAGLGDENNSGFADEGQSLTNTPPDTDGDGTPDYLDLDSDGDGTFDIVGTEFAALDTDGDGRIDAGPDADSDGIIDSRDGDPTAFGNWHDTDGDGIQDNADADIDNDGIPNEIDGIDVDSDGDGIPNAADLDSDNDGIPDLVEAGGTDADGDGTVDNATDGNGNGLADVFDLAAGGLPLAVPDTDGDGDPDFIDIDSDGDGLTDVFETGGTDADGDGHIDDFIDADADGLADAVDGSQPGASPVVPVDTDGDGIPDYRDTDSDGDGLSDKQEGSGDSDGDGIPNYRDAASQVRTAVSGTGSVDPLMLGLLLLGVLLRHRRYLRRRGVGPAALCLALALALGAGMMRPARAQPAESAAAQAEQAGQWAVGVGLGISRLRPRGGADYLVSDETSSGFELSGSYRWSERWTFKGFYRDLGAARIASANPAIGDLGDLRYRVVGAGALYRLLPSSNMRVHPWLQAGLARTSNSVSDSRIRYERSHRIGLYFGAAAAWRLTGPWRLRAELVSYDRDEAALSIGVTHDF